MPCAVSCITFVQAMVVDTAPDAMSPRSSELACVLHFCTTSRDITTCVNSVTCRQVAELVRVLPSARPVEEILRLITAFSLSKGPAGTMRTTRSTLNRPFIFLYVRSQDAESITGRILRGLLCAYDLLI